MRRIEPTAVAAVVIACASLTGCASAASGEDAADPESIAERANAAGIAPELVYTTEVDGFDLAPQSVGHGAADGLSATWFNTGTGAMVTIRSDHGELTAASCAATPLWDGPGDEVTCTYDDGIWQRIGGDVHEYVAVRGDVMIWVTGANGASPADLLAAAKAAHVPSDAELERLFSDIPETSGEPVERGDLPENGDGAPINPTGPGG